jgi:hypothetical protein
MKNINKIIIVVIIAAIIGIDVTASSMVSTDEEIIQVENEIVLQETVPVEEVVEETVPVEEVVEETGKSLSIELTESIGLKTP